MLVCILALFIFVPESGERFWHPLTMRDLVNALLGLCTFFVLLPLVIFIRAKTTMRSLAISPEGISTVIGSLQGHVAWRKIKIVEEKEGFVLIAGTSGNAFYVPNRAFATPDQKAEFVANAQTWTKASRLIN